MTIGERIKNRRIELGLTVDEIADRLGKNRATIYRYENGYIEDMPSSVLESLAVVLKTTPADLMGWIDKSSITVTAAERDVLEKYRRLDPADKGRIHERLDTLLESDKYKKEPSRAAM